MFNQRGSFLMQALLAIALIVAFMPLLARKIARQSLDSRMFATAAQISSAVGAARLFVRENPDWNGLLKGDAFVDFLEPYGLPLGFDAEKISLSPRASREAPKKEGGAESPILEYLDNSLSKTQLAELAARVGMNARAGADRLIIPISAEEDFSELVKKKSQTTQEFLSPLLMDGFNITDAGAVAAETAEFQIAELTQLTLFGLDDGRKLRSKIDSLSADKAVFGGGLAVSRGTLAAGDLRARSIADFGDSGNLTADMVSAKDFSLTAGRTGFTGPAKWSVGGNLTTGNVSFTTALLELSSFINAARGLDVFIDDDGLNYSAKSGIDAGMVSAAHITLRDQISSSLAQGGTGPVIVDIRVAGTSVLPDILLDGLNADELKIIKDPNGNFGDTVQCKTIIAGLGETYKSNSLAQNIICQYVFWNRLEKRIDIKKCLLEGRGNCD